MCTDYYNFWCPAMNKKFILVDWTYNHNQKDTINTKLIGLE
jgi:hypothetical protein